jgi:K319L-like, PKD domain
VPGLAARVAGWRQRFRTWPGISPQSATPVRVRVYRVEGIAGSTQAVRVYRAEGAIVTTLTAAAGPDATFDSLTVVALDGTGSSGIITSWLWEQTGGTSVTISGATSQVAHVTMPATVNGDTLTFRLTVGDGVGTSQDTVTHTVLPQTLWALRASQWVPVRSMVRV